MTSYGFKKDVAHTVAAPVVGGVWVTFLLLALVARALLAFMLGTFKLVVWFATDPKGRWYCAMAWWTVRHPRQAAAWRWAQVRHYAKKVRSAGNVR
jgi:hypothetical protein